MIPFEARRGAFVCSTDPRRLDLAAVHAFLSRSYWARGISEDVVRRSLENSLSFGLYEWERQVGFARAISDYATYAYLADVYVLERYRGLGLGLWLIQSVLSHPALQGLRRLALMTRDAQGLYRKVGFHATADPARYMEIVRSYEAEVGDPATLSPGSMT
jgi:GNAT superfamily N-acetyltransferase